MKKMPAAMQAVFCFALIVLAVMLMAIWAPVLSKAGELGLWIAFIFIGALYLIAGLPGFIEAVMTMNAEVEQQKKDAQVRTDAKDAKTTATPAEPKGG